MIKWISIIMVSLGMIVGAIFFLEDRYFNNTQAKELKTTIVEKIVKVKQEVTKESVETFKDVQQSFQSMQRDNDSNRLEALRDRKYLLEKQLEKEPNNELLEDKVKILQRKIEKLENKLDQ